MTKDQIFIKMKEILVETFEIDEGNIKPDARLFENLELDSIDAVDLIVKLQQLTGRKIDPETFKKVRTVQDVVDSVYAMLESTGSK